MPLEKSRFLQKPLSIGTAASQRRCSNGLGQATTGCVAGALSDYEYVAKLAKAGFEGIGIEATRVYDVDDARTFLNGKGLDADQLARDTEGTFISAFVRATKPSHVSCCGPTCCH